MRGERESGTRRRSSSDSGTQAARPVAHTFGKRSQRPRLLLSDFSGYLVLMLPSQFAIAASV